MSALGVIVPCRDEAAVIERKLSNLARCAWPAGARPHRVVVVDDGSRDVTRELAIGCARRFAGLGVALEVVANGVRPGKSGAIEQGLRALGDSIDVLVLTDADVVLAPDALAALAAAFDGEPGLAMACGAQRFVESLAADGSLRAGGGGDFVGASTLYDRITARVRAFESRFGRVFSVHGQLLAWRRELELHPTPGIAADDLDLMLQVRARGLPIRWIAAARFFETRPAARQCRDAQALRRARAYVQFLGHPRLGELTDRGPRLARWQARAYLRLERAGLGAFAGVRRRIRLARELETRGTMGDRWETARR